MSNRTVVHFGQDVHNDRNGTLYLVHNTIVTPFLSPVVDLSAAHVRACLVGNLIWDDGSGQKNQVLVKNRTGGPEDGLVTGRDNFFCGGFGPQGNLGTSVASGEPPPGKQQLRLARYSWRRRRGIIISRRRTRGFAVGWGR